jgi:hypothetical protein
MVLPSPNGVWKIPPLSLTLETNSPNFSLMLFKLFETGSDHSHLTVHSYPAILHVMLQQIGLSHKLGQSFLDKQRDYQLLKKNSFPQS